LLFNLYFNVESTATISSSMDSCNQQTTSLNHHQVIAANTKGKHA